MKRLVLCCDGTWNSADQESNGIPCPTNVVRIAYLAAKSDGPVTQAIYYDQGVGTGNVLDRLTGGAFGDGLEANVWDAYRFLIANYEAGDELFLFGFSRGAFTARSIGGLIRKCGILKRPSVRKYREAAQLYRGPEHPNDAGPLAFRKEHSITAEAPIPIKFIGVWDTVGALGIPLAGLRQWTRKGYQFHDTELSSTVQYAYHALAIDEHRTPFEPTLWAYRPKPGQCIEQVWFCGAHSDVGGGYAERKLSDIPLLWMMEKARGAGLALDDSAAAANPASPDPRGLLHNSKGGLYTIFPGLDRPIGLAKDLAHPEAPASVQDPTQSVHPTVLQRWDDDAKYRPKALREYFRRTGDQRGA